MDGDSRRGRARSFVLGGLVGVSAAIATGARRRAVTRRRAERVERPAGLAAFEGAPCFEEALEEATSPPEPRRTSDAG